MLNIEKKKGALGKNDWLKSVAKQKDTMKTMGTEI